MQKLNDMLTYHSLLIVAVLAGSGGPLTPGACVEKAGAIVTEAAFEARSVTDGTGSERCRGGSALRVTVVRPGRNTSKGIIIN